MELPNYNNTDFPLAIKTQLSKFENDDARLKYHQFVVKKFISMSKKQKGILIKHDMGLGKTRIAVAIAEFYREEEPNRQVIILLPKSLEGNFKNNIIQYSNKSPDYIDKNYKFVSLNSSNMFKKMAQLDKSKEELDMEKRLGMFLEHNSDTLDNSLLIIDEAHNLFNAISNGSKNGLALYDLILQSKNLKLIFLTGTPIINSPFELVPCFNMLRGYMKIDGGADDEVVYSDAENYDPEKFKEKMNEKMNEKVRVKEKPKAGPKEKVRGVRKSRKSDDDHTLLFTESYEEFESYFVDTEKNTIKNKQKFMNRIYGLSSYYGDLYFDQTNKEGFPKKLPEIIEKISMSKTQYARYVDARILENEESGFAKKKGDGRFSSSKSSSTYRVKSRQISNYCIPDYALGPKVGNKSREKFVDKITTEDILNTVEFSPKMGKIYENLSTKFPNRPGLIYSQFVSGEGLNIMARILEANGYENYSASGSDEYSMNDIKDATKVAGDEAQESETDIYSLPKPEYTKESTKEYTKEPIKAAPKKPNKKRFAILSGDITPEEREQLIKDFNDMNNKDGSIIHILLLSGAVAEGIDLKRVRHVHIMEPFWNYARINQVETRAIRYLSHEGLPEEEKNVQVFIYLSDYPSKQDEKKMKEKTTDVDMFDNSKNNMKIINSFIQALAESSIDCSLHYNNLPENIKKNIHCMICNPTNKQLFYPILYKDMTLPNPCEHYAEKKVKVKELIFEPTGEKYYYKENSPNNITVYSYDKKINGYVEMKDTNPIYASILSNIIQTPDLDI